MNNIMSGVDTSDVNEKIIDFSKKESNMDNFQSNFPEILSQ